MQFTIRKMMLAVAIAAVVCGEMRLYKYAAYVVGDGWDGGYLVHEAIGVWGVMNAALAVPVFILYQALCLWGFRRRDLDPPLRK
jgi:hypothetical protein